VDDPPHSLQQLDEATRGIEMQGSLILCYHRINDDNHSCLRPTKVEAFEKQMRYLSKAYHPEPLEKIVQHLQDGTPSDPPSGSLAITFDDGYRDNYENAYPILKKYGIPATLFLTTGYIGTGEIPWWEKVYHLLSRAKKGALVSTRSEGPQLNAPFDQKSIYRVVRMLKPLDEKERNLTIADFADAFDLWGEPPAEKDMMLSWDEVREMSDHGISFGAHTLTHPLLTHIPPKQAQNEIHLSKKIIEEQIGKRVITFAYPGGDFDARIKKMVKDAGYSAAVSTIPGYNSSKSNLYMLKRNPISLCSKYNFFPVFIAEVTGILGHFRRFYHRMGRLQN